MRNRHWSSSGAPRSRILLITVPLVITMAVGLVLGLHFVSQGNASLKLSAQGAGAATATPAATAATGTASPSASAAATATASAAAAPAAAAANVSCVLVVPANPLTAQGLAAPYQLTGPNGMSPQASGCTMASQNFGLANPVTVTLGGNGAATAATINATQQAVASMTGPAGPANPAAPARPKHGQNPARM